jgi:signal transduction histidine kinase
MLGAAAVFALLMTTVVSPPVAGALVRLEEENRLFRIVGELKGLDEALVEKRLAALEGVRVEKAGRLPQEAIEVPFQAGTVLVSDRRPSFWEAAKVVRIPPYRNLMALVLGGCLLYALAALLARFVSRPVGDLLRGVRALEEGKKGVTVPVPRETELAELALSFNRMASRLSQRERELEQALKAKEMLFANASHELRTPLTVISGYCQMLREGLKGELSGEQLDCLAVVERNASGLLQQVEALLTLSQLRSGALPFQRETFDLRDLVHELVEEMSELAEVRGLVLDLELPDEVVPVTLDFHRGQQILRNLLANALKFTRSGEVKVEVLESKEVKVVDTGPGVPLEFQERLFSEFSRGPHTEGVPGAGLGLALSRRLAESMGGTVELKESSDNGSVFLWVAGGADSCQGVLLDGEEHTCG